MTGSSWSFVRKIETAKIFSSLKIQSRTRGGGEETFEASLQEMRVELEKTFTLNSPWSLLLMLERNLSSSPLTELP